MKSLGNRNRFKGAAFARKDRTSESRARNLGVQAPVIGILKQAQTNSRECKMANPRQDDKGAQTAEEAVRRTGERTAEQIRNVGETAVHSGEEVVRAGADLLQKNAQTLQNAFRFGLDATTAVMGR